MIWLNKLVSVITVQSSIMSVMDLIFDSIWKNLSKSSTKQWQTAFVMSYKLNLAMFEWGCLFWKI